MGKGPDLEGVIRNNSSGDFKSEGERKIAYFLDANSFKYRYETGVLVRAGSEKTRIWYPDFYLPEFKTYIEYYGMAGNKCYDTGIKTKDSIYAKTGIDVIAVYPWMFAENWEGYIMRELKRGIYRKYRDLAQKPMWSNSKAASYINGSSPSMGYRKRLNRQY